VPSASVACMWKETSGVPLGEGIVEVSPNLEGDTTEFGPQEDAGLAHKPLGFSNRPLVSSHTRAMYLPRSHS